jgi:peptidyl-tRNA hydrolase, PTH1 family
MRLFVGTRESGRKICPEPAQHRLHGRGPDRGRPRLRALAGEVPGPRGEGRLGTERVALLKPETFMNLSGQSVGEAMRFFRLEPAAT